MIISIFNTNKIIIKYSKIFSTNLLFLKIKETIILYFKIKILIKLNLKMIN